MADLNSSGHAPFFSVLVPCYNVQDYVEECIDSVLEQSFDSWEVVAIDDGSTDSTGEMLDALADRVGSRMSVVHTPNNGLLLARREAFSRAAGRYVICLDSDDKLRQGALGRLAEVLRQNPESLVQFRFSRRPDFEGAAGPEYPEGAAGIRLDISWLRRQVCSSSAYNNLCGKVIPRDCVEFDRDYSDYKSVRNAEDLLQLVEILEHAKSVVLVEDVLYYYRVNEGSITKTFQSNFYDSVRTANRALWDAARHWDDSGLEKLVAKRWLRAVVAAMAQLSRSGYSVSRATAELNGYACDGLTIRAWALASGSVNGKAGILLKLLMAGRYRLLALALLSVGRALR